MMDHFLEEVVVKRSRGVNEILYALSNVVMVVAALIAFMLLNTIFRGFNVIVLIVMLLSGAVALLLFMYRDRLRTEYEYTFTNGDLDFAKVFNNQKRKTLGTMRVKNVEAFGPVDSEQFRKLINMPNLNRRNWFLNRDAKLYYFYYQKESARNVIVLEPSEELVGMIKKYLPQGVAHN
ncbi:MAG: hypothetical protein E7319_06195 [Clostridiales bacterium]|nr:hypothetical protein [Clostridiales bacterium]